MSDINKTCIIDGKEYVLSDVEAMGFDGFSVSAHVSPYRSLFKYYPNTKKYVSREKKYRNCSFEAFRLQIRYRHRQKQVYRKCSNFRYRMQMQSKK